VLAEWRRLERLFDAGIGDADRGRVTRRIEELKAEYRAATDSVRDATKDLLAFHSLEMDVDPRS
jgi:hypothetical protein